MDEIFRDSALNNHYVKNQVVRLTYVCLGKGEVTASKDKGNWNPHIMCASMGWALQQSHSRVGHHFIKEKTKTQGSEMICSKFPKWQFLQVTEPGFKLHQLIARPRTTRFCGLGKTQEHVTAGTKLYSFASHIISKIFRRQSWLHYGIISFTCSEALVTEAF